MKVALITLAFASLAHAHVLVAPGSPYLAVGKKPFFVVDPSYGGVPPFVNPVTVIFVSPGTVDKTKDTGPGKPVAPKEPAPGREPAVSAKPAFPAPGDDQDVPPPAGEGNDEGVDEVLDVDGPIEHPTLNGDEEDDNGLGFKKPGDEDTPAVSAKPAFNVPEEGDDDGATEGSSGTGEKKPADGDGDRGIEKDPYVPFVKLPSGVFSPVLVGTVPGSKPKDGGIPTQRKGGVPPGAVYYFGYVVPPGYPYPGYPYSGYPHVTPHVVYRHASYPYVKLG